MKHRRYMRLFGWMAAAVLLLTTSCKDELVEGSNGMSDEVTVSFTLAPEAAAMVTRADGEDGYVTYPEDGLGHISDGSKADMLIYAIYDSKDQLLDEYSDNTAEEITELESLGIKPGFGQTIKLLKPGKSFPTTINLTLKRGEEYTIAFWAQSRKTKAYNTSDLKKVEVIYSVVADEIQQQNPGEARAVDEDASNTKSSTPNNDEFRDVFCRSVKLTIGADGINQNVYLYRPLAQINIGTSGYDFEVATRGSESHQYKYSKVRINRVARYLDVVQDKTITSTTDNGQNEGVKTPESFAVVDFGYAPIPAYVNYRDKETNEYTDLPSEVSYTVWDWIYGSAPSDFSENEYQKEEFLRVKLFNAENDKDKEDYTTDEYDPYNYKDDKGAVTKKIDNFRDYANVSRNNKLSETFKYLSMSYVLTSSTKEEPIVINNIKMWLATDADGANETQVLDIDHVPAQRNWRTNIIGNLLTAEQTFNVSLDRDFAGEYNGWGQNDEWEYLSGPIADGVYYDAQADEIQISNANGLLWLQRMVNGKIVVREDKTTEYSKIVGQDLQYNNEDGDEKTFHYEYIDPEKLNDDVLLRRIIKATHIDENTALSQRDGKTMVGSKKDIKWPNNYNFNFYGATIKLMADIDLAGIEWVPIGWDFALHDTSIAGDINQTKPKIDYCDVNYKQGLRRVFCGTFDGNGHTIKNLKTFRVAANVHDTSLQTMSRGPYDNFQWYPRGLFGLVVDHAKIKDVRLQNVDVKGYNACGALVGIVFSGDGETGDMSIENCYVDGGTVSASPMYRGDASYGSIVKNRTFARGVYVGGLVGNIVIGGASKDQFKLTGCDVRNLTIRAYRQTGGFVGGIGNYENYKEDDRAISRPWDWQKQQYELTISGNTISDVLIICNQFQAFSYLDNKIDNGVWKNGFGWNSTYRTLAYPVVGGLYMTSDSDGETLKLINGYNDANPQQNNVTIAEYATSIAADGKSRNAEIGAAPLYELPMLSSWFCDNIILNSNYYGQPSAYVGFNDLTSFVPKPKSNADAEKATFEVPFNLPYDLAPDYDTSSPRAGVYVESVALDGKGGIGGRSVITPEGITSEGSCAMYVTARNRKQFYDKLSGLSNNAYKKPTIISNVVLRGAPNYAWAGLQIAPNENMSYVQLDNVAIYDVHRTITLDETRTLWTNANNVELKVNNSNLRGYTVPGKGWNQITYQGTTFEQGSTTGAESNANEMMTCKVEGPTTFDGCFFKAPYIIDLEVENLSVVKFINSNATSTNQNNKMIDLTGKTGCKYITITSTSQGDPVITYYDSNGKDMDAPDESSPARRR